MKKYILSIALITTALTPTLHGWWPFDGQQAKTVYEICKKCGGKLPVASTQPSIMEHLANGVSQDWKIIAGAAAATACMGSAFNWATSKGNKPARSAASTAVKSGILGGTLAATASILKTLYNESPEAFSKENILLGTSAAAFFATGACVLYPKWHVMQTKKQEKKEFVAYLRGLVAYIRNEVKNEVDPEARKITNEQAIINWLPKYLKEDVGLVRSGTASSSLIQQFITAYNALDVNNLDLTNVERVIATIDMYLKNK